MPGKWRRDVRQGESEGRLYGRAASRPRGLPIVPDSESLAVRAEGDAKDRAALGEGGRPRPAGRAPQPDVTATDDGEQFTFSSASVGRLALTLYRLLRDRGLDLPDDDELVAELSSVVLRESQPGNYRIDTTGHGHDDRVISLALVAQHLASQSSGILPHLGAQRSSRTIHQHRPTRCKMTREDADQWLTTYEDHDEWYRVVLPKLREMGIKAVAENVGMSERRVRDVLTGRALPHLGRRGALTQLPAQLPHRQP